MPQPTFELAIDLCASKRCAQTSKLAIHARHLEDVLELLEHVKGLRKPGLGDVQERQVSGERPDRV